MTQQGCCAVRLLILCALSLPAHGQDDESAWAFSLDSIMVKGYQTRLSLKSSQSGETLWNLGTMSLLPQVLGNAEPVRYAQMLPGIQTNSEFRSGINIEGCDNQHNTLSIEGVPIYNVNHLLGFFSVFNAPHFPSMSVAKSALSASSPSRLGGQLNMLHDTLQHQQASGIVSLGLISSQGTVRLPLGARTMLSMSLRGSYMNLLYSRWMQADDQQVRYSFYDANATLVHRPNSRNTLLLDLYSGNDRGSLDEDNYLASMTARWGNTMGALHWLHTGQRLSAHTTAYVTAYRNRFALDMQDMAFRLPSGIADVGLKSSLAWKGCTAGAEAVWHDIRPQSLEHQGTFNVSDGHASPMRSLEAAAFLDYAHRLSARMSVAGGLRATVFAGSKATYGALDPSVRWLCDAGEWSLSATYALRHQYLFQTGFSDMGLPTEFWLSASSRFKPQYAHEATVSGSRSLFGRQCTVSASLFYRRLYHQLAYKGSLFDYVNSVYDIESSLMYGQGENYGFSIMVSKTGGRLTGWLSYTFTHARRSFDEMGRQKYYPASHERPHELNGVAVFTLNRHWNFGATVVAASGNPFTQARSFLLLNDNLIMKYGDYNAARLRPYMRLDLSVNYQWKNAGKREQGLNFSVYNATNRGNELFYYLKKRSDGTFAYRPVTFVLHTLPSISYYFKF